MILDLTELKRPYHFLKGVAANVKYGFPSKKLRVIAVTGTDGKTTTSTLIYHILKTAGKKVALISTVAAYIGDKEIDTGFHVTSPEEFQLQRLLKDIADQGYEFVVLEATSHGIHQFRLFGIVPEICVLTNITHEHLDYHKTYERYVQVKASLLSMSRTVVINQDDMSYAPVLDILKKHSRVKISTYSGKILPKELQYPVTSRFPEPYNHANAMAAITTAQMLDVSNTVVVRAISLFPPVSGRMEEIPNKKGIRVIVDFAHTPNALKVALEALQKQRKPGNKLIAVFGSAGLRDHTKRPLMGKAASELADEVVLTAEDPRTEDVHVIIRQIKEGATRNYGHIHEVVDRKKAIYFAIQTLAKRGDIVGIFGKGHEKSMNLDGKVEISWSDQKTARAACLGI